MQAVRRLYLYVMSGITLAVISYGLVLLLRVLLDGLFPDPPFGGSDLSREQLSAAIAMLGVGVPVWGVHWWLVQRGLRPGRPERDAERGSGARAVYITFVLLVSLVAWVTGAHSRSSSGRRLPPCASPRTTPTTQILSAGPRSASSGLSSGSTTAWCAGATSRRGRWRASRPRCRACTCTELPSARSGRSSLPLTRPSAPCCRCTPYPGVVSVPGPVPPRPCAQRRGVGTGLVRALDVREPPRPRGRLARHRGAGLANAPRRIPGRDHRPGRGCRSP